VAGILPDIAMPPRDEVVPLTDSAQGAPGASKPQSPQPPAPATAH
jgi:hypothetical protein